MTRAVVDRVQGGVGRRARGWEQAASACVSAPGEAACRIPQTVHTVPSVQVHHHVCRRRGPIGE